MHERSICTIQRAPLLLRPLSSGINLTTRLMGAEREKLAASGQLRGAKKAMCSTRGKWALFHSYVRRRERVHAMIRLCICTVHMRPGPQALGHGASYCSHRGETKWSSARDGVNIVGAECIRDTGAPPWGHAADKLPRIRVDEALGAFTARRIQARLGVVAVRSSQLHEQLLFARSTRARARAPTTKSGVIGAIRS